LFGNPPLSENLFKLIFCGFVILGCTIQLDAVLELSDALVFIVAIPNIIGLYLLAPVIRRELKGYHERLAAGETK
jgi:AGCS family alanine or glycine:cation symporter